MKKTELREIIKEELKK